MHLYLHFQSQRWTLSPFLKRLIELQAADPKLLLPFHLFFFFSFSSDPSGIRSRPASACGATPWCLGSTPSWLCCSSLSSPWWWWTRLASAWTSSPRSGAHILACWSTLAPHLEQTNAHLVLCFPQFFIYGGYFALISLVFFFAGLWKVFSRRRSGQVAVETSPAGLETDSPPISGPECYTQTDATAVHGNGHFPAQQR